jgi:hypothetical protein
MAMYICCNIICEVYFIFVMLCVCVYKEFIYLSKYKTK